MNNSPPDNTELATIPTVSALSRTAALPAEKKRSSWQCRSCSCSNTELCKELMREWSKLGQDYTHMLNYIEIPPIKTGEKVTPQNQHANGYHNVCVRHLSSKRETFGKSFHVALHHYKPCLRKALVRSKQEKSNLKKYRCSKLEAKEAALTEADLCNVPLKDAVQTYYIAPNNLDFDDIQYEIIEAHADVQIKLYASSLSFKKKRLDSNVASSPSTPPLAQFTSPPAGPIEARLRQQLIQRQQSEQNMRRRLVHDFDNQCKEFRETPEKFVLVMDVLKKRVLALEKDLRRVQLEKEEVVADMQCVIDGLREELTKYT